MTVKEMFEAKYREYMEHINRRAWENAKFYAEHKRIPVHQFVLLSIEITGADLKNDILIAKVLKKILKQQLQ